MANVTIYFIQCLEAWIIKSVFFHEVIEINVNKCVIFNYWYYLNLTSINVFFMQFVKFVVNRNEEPFSKPKITDLNWQFS